MKNVRRIILSLICILPLELGCGSDSPAVEHKTHILVHGAWMGAWCWDDVAAGLRKEGASVVTVELPAHGDDMTPLPEATLDAYVARVSDAIDKAGEPVILVGHSMGGMVITAAAERAPEKIAKLVYLGAYLPKDGESLFDLASTDADSHLGPALKIDQEHGIASIPLESLSDIFIADGTPDAIDLVKSKYRDEPLAPFVTPVHTTAASWGAVAKVYIYTKQDHAVSYALQQRMTSSVTFETTATLDTSHAPFLSQPDRVVSTLNGL